MIKNIIKNLIYRLHLHSNRKLIIITSDDWGSVRLSSTRIRNQLLAKGIIDKSNRFDCFDTIESNQDLENLFNVLIKYKDHNGYHPVFTAVTSVANPNFEKIRQSDFQDYFFEPITETFNRYPSSSKVLNLYKEGHSLGIFKPESHGREHLNVAWWLQMLKDQNSIARDAFDLNYYYLSNNQNASLEELPLSAAFDLLDTNDILEHKKIIKCGLNLFKEIMEYEANYFTPPSQKYHTDLEPVLLSKGIKWLDVPIWQKMPIGNGKVRHRFHYLGQKGSSGLRYLVRNAVFEPNMDQHNDGVDTCLAQIATAFKSNVPAIISNHRVAFVGGIDPKNRDKGLRSLDNLLKNILKKWPDAEFITVRDLDNLLIKN